MQIDAATYYSLIGFIILLSALLVGVIFSYIITLRRVAALEKKEKEIVGEAQDQAKRIISQANQIHDTSAKVLEEAVENLEKGEEEELTRKSADVMKSFDEKIEELNTNNIKEFGNVSEDIKKTINLHFEELKKLLSEQTVESQQQAEMKIKEEYDALEKELAVYKQEQIDKINKNIYQILVNVSKSVFGKRLDTKEHEEMIIQALNEAEKEVERT